MTDIMSLKGVMVCKIGEHLRSMGNNKQKICETVTVVVMLLFLPIVKRVDLPFMGIL